jgi:hypothetical protein
VKDAAREDAELAAVGVQPEPQQVILGNVYALGCVDEELDRPRQQKLRFAAVDVAVPVFLDDVVGESGLDEAARFDVYDLRLDGLTADSGEPVIWTRPLLTMAWMTRSETPACFSAISESASVVYWPGCAPMVWTMRSSLRPALVMRRTESLVIFVCTVFGTGSGPATAPPSTASCA